MPNRISKCPKQIFARNQTTQQLLSTKHQILNMGSWLHRCVLSWQRNLARNHSTLAEQLVAAMDKSSFHLIEKVAPAGAGYINFHVNFAKFSALTLESVKAVRVQNMVLSRLINPKKSSLNTPALTRFILSILGKPETPCSATR